MADGDVLARIAAWEAAGLIDPETATRLRAAEVERPVSPPEAPSGARSVFGPTPTVAEVLGYVGGAFVMAAWFVLMSARSSGGDDATMSITFGVAAAASIGVGVLVRRRGERGSRAAGVLFAVATATALGFGIYIARAALLVADSDRLLVGGLIAVVVAVLLRSRHPALMTQAALLGAILGLAMGVGGALKVRLGLGQFGESASEMAPDLALWLVAAVVLGLVAWRESKIPGEAAARRTGLSRFSAGLTAVAATASVLTRSGPLGGVNEYGGFDYGRLLEPAIGDAAIALVAAGLLWLAFRRSATAYLYPAALGIVIVLTDLNGSYIADQVGIGFALLLEGLVILGAGLAADRLRRRLGESDATAESATPVG